ncbi:MAG: flavodoxin-dependent (E)-4-hydroxy-3-methylbut-2-enyl-diphosphate synthase [Fidelibacterota bacterium]
MAQSIRMIEAGSEYVRITAPSIKEAENLANIKSELHKRGYRTPLIADIHFTPNAAETAARIVEKVRVNPGNYADKKKFQIREYTDQSYKDELDRIYARFTPLVKICKEYGTAMRIGTNHGSLSDRIMNRYGDTASGMVESALEFLRICEDLGYHDIVLSMKSSNPMVMVQANRLLVNRMDQEGMQYPLHLGVTEAGEGEDGRIKSAIGIGTLLEDGLGDTIRVSLTEEPEAELPVARSIVERYSRQTNATPNKDQPNPINPFEYARRETIDVACVGGSYVPQVIADISSLRGSGNTDIPQSFLQPADQSPDGFYIGKSCPVVLPGEKYILTDDMAESGSDRMYQMMDYHTFENQLIQFETPFFLKLDVKRGLPNANFPENAILLLTCSDTRKFHVYRRFVFSLIEKGVRNPVIFSTGRLNGTQEEQLIQLSIELGGLFLDGLGDGIWVDEPTRQKLNVIFGILQSTRQRITQTEYISCPSCGRTLFNLQDTSGKIRERTSHLKGLKIGIMGCIVNGPGEMADADYGYVGTGKGQISLFRGKELVMRNIPSESAVERMIELIKSDGKWVEQVHE